MATHFREEELEEHGVIRELKPSMYECSGGNHHQQYILEDTGNMETAPGCSVQPTSTTSKEAASIYRVADCGGRTPEDEADTDVDTDDDVGSQSQEQVQEEPSKEEKEVVSESVVNKEKINSSQN